MRSLYRIEFLYIIRELKKLEGERFENAYVFNEIYRLKFKHSVNFELGKRINLAYIIYPSGQTNRVVQKLRTYRNSILKEVFLLDEDRVVVFDFGNWRLILEMFGKGDVMIKEGENTVFYLRHPEPKTKPYKKDLWDSSNMERYIATAFGKPYVPLLMDKLTGDIERDVEIVKGMLAPYCSKDDFRVVEAPGFERCDELSPFLDKLYERAFVDDSKLKALEKSKQQLLEEIEQVKQEIEKNTAIGQAILERYTEIEEALKKAKEKEFYYDL
ncbi:MAG: hypothetical protein GXN92_01495 [Candidatus Micrarchaeota archaeon]|nr:hypothetical protein [Candidatus Micrarchaeota archaeon]